MNSYPKLFYILKEINLFDKTNLVDELNSLLKQKNVTKPEIIDYFKKPYLKWFVSPTDDQEKQHYVKKHHVSSGDPEWAKNTFDFNHLSTEHKEELLHTIDFFNQLNERDLKKIHKIPFPTVRELVKKWDQDLAKRMNSSIHHFKIGKDVEILKQWPNGYKIVKILSDEARKEEGDIMGHCVGGDYYANETILSLRDEHGMPHVTMEVNPNDEIQQIKGKQNAAPVDKYVPYIREFIDENKLIVKSDGKNIGLVLWGDTYYDPDGQEWKAVYGNKIIPLQLRRIDKIKEKFRDGEIYGDVYLGDMYLKNMPSFLSGIVIRGSLSLFNSSLTSLENFPKKVTGRLDISENRGITSLENCPEVGSAFDASSCSLTSLEHGPTTNNLTTYYCYDNKLTNLHGAPRIVEDIFDCAENQLTTLEGGPEKVREYYCSENNLVSLKGAPLEVSTFSAVRNNLESLEGFPQIVHNNVYVRAQKNHKHFTPEDIPNTVRTYPIFLDSTRLQHLRPNISI